MNKQPQGPSAPKISSVEAAQVADEEAIDQFCWTMAQTLKRILGLAPSGADEFDVDE